MLIPSTFISTVVPYLAFIFERIFIASVFSLILSLFFLSDIKATVVFIVSSVAPPFISICITTFASAELPVAPTNNSKSATNVPPDSARSANLIATNGSIDPAPSSS